MKNNYEYDFLLKEHKQIEYGQIHIFFIILQSLFEKKNVFLYPHTK